MMKLEDLFYISNSYINLYDKPLILIKCSSHIYLNSILQNLNKVGVRQICRSCLLS